ncbi:MULTISPECIES: DUF2955 domain-containing protein [Falsihalocynthiibacter]|uniref:DUF2955 domain-containing protein n=1 Tax=Falsihalocynthiibacter TaxID=2854182 RepID=UPI003001193B
MLTEDYRSVVRLAVGTTVVFTLGLAMGWPLAFIGALFTTLFLQAPAPMPPKVSLKLFTLALLLMITSWVLSSLLSPYPLVFLAVVCIGIIMSFTWSLSGAGILPGVLALMAAMMVPNVVFQSQEIALVLAIWIPINLLIAGYTSALMFLIIPVREPAVAKAPPKPAPEFDSLRRLLRMSLVTVPFALIFFISGSSALLVLFFVALLSQQLAAMAGAGKNVGKAMLISNGLGAVVAILCFEINVIAPSLVTPALLCLLLCLSLGALGKSKSKLAPAAGSAITTALVIYGGSIGFFADEADAKSITRVLQIGSAVMFVIVAYIVVDEFWPERKPRNAV